MNILLADDSKMISDSIVQILENFPQFRKITAVEDGKAAVAKFKKARFDIVILDIMMPNMNGIEVLEILKKINPNVIVIIFTNYPTEDIRKKCLKLGADYFFDKVKDSLKFYNVFKDLSQKNNLAGAQSKISK